MNSKHDSENKQVPTVDTDTNSTQDEAISETRRAFILKYGALAAITPVAMTLTMHNKKALANSCTECGP